MRFAIYLLTGAPDWNGWLRRSAETEHEQME
jgi:hypothetical protein